MRIPARILPAIVIAQFCCVSIWFAGNGVMGDLAAHFNLPEVALGHLTSGVQFGFIAGTLCFALFTIADRYSPSKVFFLSALAGAAFNLAAIFPGQELWSLFALRFATGFFLAGIYPVGMKIAADYYEKGLEKSLGFLVGALVLGTAFPHLLKTLTTGFPWRSVMFGTSGLALLGGLLVVLLVPDGPHRKAGEKPDFSAWFKVFRKSEFRAPAFGYFGHMWELYAFWAFLPVALAFHAERYPLRPMDVSLWSFVIISAGGLACVAGGYLARRMGTKRAAFFALAASGLCCLVSPFVLETESSFVFLAFLFFWGWMVAGDSPLFSTLVAQNAPAEMKGTALTIVNCIGFAITIASIQLLNFLSHSLRWEPSIIFLVLGIGPVLGLIGLYGKKGLQEFEDE